MADVTDNLAAAAETEEQSAPTATGNAVSDAPTKSPIASTIKASPLIEETSNAPSVTTESENSSLSEMEQRGKQALDDISAELARIEQMAREATDAAVIPDDTVVDTEANPELAPKPPADDVTPGEVEHAAPEDTPQPNQADPQDDSATMARLEQMSLEEQEAIPSLDDGSDETSLISNKSGASTNDAPAPSDGVEAGEDIDDIAGEPARIEQMAREATDAAVIPDDTVSNAKTNSEVATESLTEEIAPGVVEDAASEDTPPLNVVDLQDDAATVAHVEQVNQEATDTTVISNDTVVDTEANPELAAEPPADDVMPGEVENAALEDTPQPNQADPQDDAATLSRVEQVNQEATDTTVIPNDTVADTEANSEIATEPPADDVTPGAIENATPEDTPQPNQADPQDDSATMARLEQTSLEEQEAIPSLDDGSDEASLTSNESGASTNDAPAPSDGVEAREDIDDIAGEPARIEQMAREATEGPVIPDGAVFDTEDKPEVATEPPVDAVTPGSVENVAPENTPQQDGVDPKEIAAAMARFEQMAREATEAAGIPDDDATNAKANSEVTTEPPADAVMPGAIENPSPAETPQSNVADPQDITAAMARLEQMSLEEKEAIPSLDDGHDEPPLAPEESGVGATDTQASQDEAASSEDFNDIDAELARIEQMSQEEVEAIPSLDDENEDESTEEAAPSVPDPSDGTNAADDELAAALAEVEKISTKTKTTVEKPTQQQADAAEEKKETPPADEAGKTKKAPQFKIGKKEQTEPKAETGGAIPKSALGRRIYEFWNQVLERINQPFRNLSEPKRKLIGIIALTTIGVSILATFLMPIFVPNRDAITFLQERRAALDQPPPPTEEELKQAKSDKPKP